MYPRHHAIRQEAGVASAAVAGSNSGSLAIGVAGAAAGVEIGGGTTACGDSGPCGRRVSRIPANRASAASSAMSPPIPAGAIHEFPADCPAGAGTGVGAGARAGFGAFVAGRGGCLRGGEGVARWLWWTAAFFAGCVIVTGRELCGCGEIRKGAVG
jgi:hypothetical protein